jgi:hypothetical protein
MLLLIYITTTSCSVLVKALSLSSVVSLMSPVRPNAAANAGTSTSNSVPVKQQIQWLGTRVSSASRVSQREQEYEQDADRDFDNEELIDGLDVGQASQELQRIKTKQTESPFKERQVWQALANLEKDSTYCCSALQRLPHVFGLIIFMDCFWLI